MAKDGEAAPINTVFVRGVIRQRWWRSTTEQFSLKTTGAQELVEYHTERTIKFHKVLCISGCKTNGLKQKLAKNSIRKHGTFVSEEDKLPKKMNKQQKTPFFTLHIHSHLAYEE